MFKDYLKAGILGGVADQNDSSCQSNKNLLALSLENSKYGLTNLDLKICNEKLDKQRAFLTSNFFTSNITGEIRSFFELSRSANFSKKYYASLTNRCNVINSFSFDDDLIPVFITITLNGCFRKHQFMPLNAIFRDFIFYGLQDRLQNSFKK